MYLSILDEPTDEELVKYPSVHLTSIHEWDPSILDFSYPEKDDPQHGDVIDPNFDSKGLYTKRVINTLSSLSHVHKIPPMAMFSPTSPSQACKHKIKLYHLNSGIQTFPDLLSCGLIWEILQYSSISRNT